jgi:Ca2+-binding EF-hand superfamily protein
MNKKRRDLVNLAFDVLDRDGSGEIDLNDMIQVYNVSQHPEFKSGKKTKEQILREMVDVFDVGGEKDGKVTREEFRNYYQQISAAIENDNMFELMIRNAWHISGGEGQAANSANRRVLVTRSDGSQYVEEVKNDLGLSSKDRAGTLARLQAQGVNANNVDFNGGMDSKNQRYRPGSAAPTTGARNSLAVSTRASSAASTRNTQSFTPAMLVAGRGDESLPFEAAPANGRGRTGARSNIGGAGGGSSMQALGAGGPRRGDQSLPPEVDEDAAGDGMHPLMRRFKDRVVSRGSSGLIGLQRKFKIMDDDGSKSLNMAEFKKAVKETVPEFSDADTATLFRLFG